MRHGKRSFIATGFIGKERPKKPKMNDIPGPGKFEGNESLRVSEDLYGLSNESWFDEQFGDTETDNWEALFVNLTIEGRKRHYIVNENSQGFFTYKAYDNEEEARAQYDQDYVQYRDEFE